MIMAITIINKKSPHKPPGHYYYVGRPSPLGNPFKIGQDGNRKAVLDKYGIWLDKRLENPASPQSREMAKLRLISLQRDLVLVCWCVPLPCHAEFIKAIIENSMAGEGILNE